MWEIIDKLEVSKKFDIICLLFLPISLPVSIVYATCKFLYIMSIGECRVKKWNTKYNVQYYTIFVRKGFRSCVFSQIPEALLLKKYKDMKNAGGTYTLSMKSNECIYTYKFTKKQKEKLIKSIEKRCLKD